MVSTILSFLKQQRGSRTWARERIFTTSCARSHSSSGVMRLHNFMLNIASVPAMVGCLLSLYLLLPTAIIVFSSPSTAHRVLQHQPRPLHHHTTRPSSSLPSTASSPPDVLPFEKCGPEFWYLFCGQGRRLEDGRRDVGSRVELCIPRGFFFVASLLQSLKGGEVSLLAHLLDILWISNFSLDVYLSVLFSSSFPFLCSHCISAIFPSSGLCRDIFPISSLSLCLVCCKTSNACEIWHVLYCFTEITYVIPWLPIPISVFHLSNT